MALPVKEIKERVQASRETIIQFMREIVAIPSMEGQLKNVGERIGAEMTKLGFDEVRFDKMGNILGRIGSQYYPNMALVFQTIHPA